MSALGFKAGVMILTNPPFLGPPRTFLIVVSGTHFSQMLLFFKLDYFKSPNVLYLSICN